MSISLLCPEAQQMVSDRGVSLAPDVIRKLSAMEDWRQTGWIHSPIIQSIIDRCISNWVAGVGVAPVEPKTIDLVVDPVVKPAEPSAVKEDDPDEMVFNLFD